MKRILNLLLLFSLLPLGAQNISDLPYYEIPKAKSPYTAQSIMIRMVDGLGFRYYWSSHDLKENDLAYKISPESRSTKETLIHIYDLTSMTLRLMKINFKQADKKENMDYSALRAQTLLNIEAISNTIKQNKDLADFDQKRNGKVTLQFYNLINGPIADAIWHTGQLAVFRRATGNPINPKVNHFSGTVRK